MKSIIRILDVRWLDDECLTIKFSCDCGAECPEFRYPGGFENEEMVAQKWPHLCCPNCGELLRVWPNSWDEISRQGCKEELAKVYDGDDIVIREIQGFGERLSQSTRSDSCDERRVLTILLDNMEYLPIHMRSKFLQNWECSVTKMKLAERIKKLAIKNVKFRKKSEPLLTKLLALNLYGQGFIDWILEYELKRSNGGFFEVVEEEQGPGKTRVLQFWWSDLPFLEVGAHVSCRCGKYPVFQNVERSPEYPTWSCPKCSSGVRLWPCSINEKLPSTHAEIKKCLRQMLLKRATSL